MKTRFISMMMFTTISAMVAPGLLAQNSIPVFGAVDTRLSQGTASYTAPNTFDTNTLNLTCPASPVAVLSSAPSSTPLSSTGNVLVDNNITLTVSYSSSGGTVTNGPTQMCPSTGYPGPTGFPNCFNTNGYQIPASAGELNGQDLDTYVLPTSEGGNGETVDQIGGVAPINVSSMLVSGAESLTIALLDEGGYLASSSLYLNTNCTQGGSTGPAVVSGNTIPPNPTPQELTQTFAFNQTTNQVVGFEYDLSGAQSSNTLTINPNGSTPQTADLPINPATFQSNFVANTPFATSQCLIHTGELGGPLGAPANQQACKLYTLECTTGTGSAATGAQCPASTVANEVVSDIFDGPSFTMPGIVTPSGQSFNTGLGFLMASEGWGSEPGVPPGTWNWNGGTGGTCTFDPASDLNLPCPQNLLISFTGPGGYSGSGLTTHPNSTFISVAGIPLVSTQIAIKGAHAGTWINSDTATLVINAIPPDLQGTTIPGAASFIPSPVQTVTFGVVPASSPLPNPINLPIAGTTTLTNTPCPIPTPGDPGPSVAPTFTPTPPQVKFTADGYYNLFYYAQDCSGTLELQFKKVSGSWTTTFFSRQINVDTAPPTITGLALSPSGGSYAVGQSVTASYSCSDTLSGVATCGTTFSTSTAGVSSTPTQTATVSTATPGTKTFTVKSTDIAGNVSTSTVNYTVGP